MSTNGDYSGYEDAHLLSKETGQFPRVINLNVGGNKFATRLSTLTKYPESMLGVMFSGRHVLDKDVDNNYFIDRDGTYFSYILNYLRNDEDLPPPRHCEAVLEDAMFYGVQSLVEHLKIQPPLFAEHVVRNKVRKKLVGYHEIKEDIAMVAREQVMETNNVISTVKLVISKNQPIPSDLQFSKQAYKQYYRQFKTYNSFQNAFGKYFINLNDDSVIGDTREVMGLIASCLCHDFVTAGYKCKYKSESVMTEFNKIKTVSWSEEEFHVCVTCHEFQFNWWNIKNFSEPASPTDD